MLETRAIAVAMLLALTGCGARSDLDLGPQQSPGGGGGAGGEPPSTACETLYIPGDGSGATDVAIDATHAYWTTNGGRVLRASLATGKSEVLFEGGERPVAIALDTDAVYAVSSAELVRIPKVGGPADPVATGPFVPVDLAIAGDTLYFLDQGETVQPGIPTRGSLSMWTLRDGLATVADAFVGSLQGLAVDERDAFVLMSMLEEGVVETQLIRIELATRDIEVRAISLNQGELAMTSTEVFYVGEPSTSRSLAIGAISRSDGAERTVAALNSAHLLRIEGLAVDGGEVFFAANRLEYNSVVQCAETAPGRVPIDGGSILALPYDRPEGALSHPAANATRVAFARRHEECSDDVDDDGIVVFCR